MRSKRNFQPNVDESLEPRTVPTGFDGIGGLIFNIPAQDAAKVGQEFVIFEKTYATDIKKILVPPGTKNAGLNRAAFDDAIRIALGTLNAAINADVANLPNAAALAATIQSELLGPNPASLQSELAAIPSPVAKNTPSIVSFAQKSQRQILPTATGVVRQVAASPTPPGSITLLAAEADYEAIQTAFIGFKQSYDLSTKTILFKPGSSLNANRAAFDEAVFSALTTLNTNIAASLVNLPPTVRSSLATTIQNDLLKGNQTTKIDLQSRLAALRTPTSTTGFPAWLFRLGSTMNTSFAQQKIAADLVAAVNAYNVKL